MCFAARTVPPWNVCGVAAAGSRASWDSPWSLEFPPQHDLTSLARRTRSPVHSQRSGVGRLSERPHAVTAAASRQIHKTVNELPSDSAPPPPLINGQLGDEHLGPLI